MAHPRNRPGAYQGASIQYAGGIAGGGGKAISAIPLPDITVVGTSVGPYVGSSNTITVPVPTGTVDGDLIFLHVGHSLNRTCTAPGYTNQVNNISNTGFQTHLLYKYYAAADGANITATLSGNCQISAAAVTLRGLNAVDPTGPNGGVFAGAFTGTPFNIGTFNTTVNNSLALFCATADNVSTYTDPQGAGLTTILNRVATGAFALPTIMFVKRITTAGATGVQPVSYSGGPVTQGGIGIELLF